MSEDVQLRHVHDGVPQAEIQFWLAESYFIARPPAPALSRSTDGGTSTPLDRDKPYWLE